MYMNIGGFNVYVNDGGPPCAKYYNLYTHTYIYIVLSPRCLINLQTNFSRVCNTVSHINVPYFVKAYVFSLFSCNKFSKLSMRYNSCTKKNVSYLLNWVIIYVP